VDKNNAFNFGNDPDRPQPHLEGKLSSYHMEFHKKATPHLQVLFNAVAEDPSFQHKTPTPAVKDAKSALEKINGLVREENAKHGQDPDLGIVRYSDFLTKWRPMFMIDDNDTKKLLHQSLLEYCKQMHYPVTWADQPPSSDPSSGQTENVPESQSTSNVVANPANKHANSQVRNHNGANTLAPPPMDPNQQQTYSGANIATAIVPQGSNTHQAFNMQGSPGTTIPQAGLQPNYISLQAASGQKRVIALKPRKIQRAIQPGFTSSGEKILFIQPFGLGARFVVTDNEGNIRLVSGSQPAIDLAKRAGVPNTLQDPAEIQELRDLVRCGGAYGLEFVAIGEWDLTSKRLPFIVVGFYHENESGRRDEAISRSALTKVLGTREAEKLVVESIVGNSAMSLKEALKSQISPGKQEHQSNNVPLLLPYGEQTQPWWFQPNSQHYGSHVGFNADHAQQPYPNQFQPVFPQQFQQSVPQQQLQQPLPQQYQQPFPHQYGPFAMPPQPILNPAMMKNGGNSPAASLMDEEEL
jgi:hypothetical protein